MKRARASASTEIDREFSKQKRKRVKMNVLNLHNLMNSRTRSE